MAGKGRTLTVYLAADTKKAEAGISRFNRILDVGLGVSLANATQQAASFARALVVDSVNAAAAESKELATLGTLLHNLGFDAASDSLNKWIDDLQYASGVTDTELRASIESLLPVTRSVTQSQNLLKVALDAAAGSGKPLESVINGLTKAAGGSSTALIKLFPELRNVAGATTDVNVAAQALSQTYGGASQANAESFAGSLGRIKIALGELQEAFGTGLIEGFVGDIGTATTATDQFVQTLRDHQPTVQTWGRDLGTLGNKALTASDGVSTLNDNIAKTAGSPNDATIFGFFAAFQRHVRAASAALTGNKVALAEANAEMGNFGEGMDGATVEALKMSRAADASDDSLRRVAIAARAAGDAAAGAVPGIDDNTDALWGNADAAAAAARAQAAAAKYGISNLSGPTNIRRAEQANGETEQANIDATTNLLYDNWVARQHVNSASRGGSSATNALTEAQKKQNAQLDKAKAKFEATNKKLEEATAKLKDAKQAWTDYYDAMVGNLSSSGGDLNSWYDEWKQHRQDIADANKEFDDAVKAADADRIEAARQKLQALGPDVGLQDFINQKMQANIDWANTIKSLGIDTSTPAGQYLSQQLTSMGAERGQDFVKGYGDGITTALPAKWTEMMAVNGTVGASLVPASLQTGIDTATAIVQGLAAQAEADGEKYEKIGKKIGKKVGKAAAAEVQAAIAAAWDTLADGPQANPIAQSQRIAQVQATAQRRLGV